MSQCITCHHRAWREINGFMVMGCPKLGLRFGIEPDLKRGFVNKEGDCVAMPKTCSDYRKG